MKTFRITYSVTGTVWIDVQAKSLSEAKSIAFTHEHPDPPPGHLEWSYEDTTSVVQLPEQG